MSAGEPRILFIAPDQEDYLADSLFHGLRQVLGERVIDAPRRDPLYSDYPEDLRARRYGHGFTLYGGLLEDVPVDRAWTALRLERGEFDLVVFGDIQNGFGRWVELRHAMRGTPAAVLDGGAIPPCTRSAPAGGATRAGGCCRALTAGPRTSSVS